MKIISIGNMKGGVGKTTTSVHLAQHLGGQGKKVLLLDADEQLQCAISWRQGDCPDWRFEVMPYKDATPAILKRYDYVLVDTKGGEGSSDLIQLAQNSALLVIPTKPDGLSATGLIKTLRPLIENGASNYRVLIVANTGGRGEELREALFAEGVPVLNTLVRSSTAVGDAAERQIPLGAYSGNRYARLVDLDYAAVSREVLSHV